MTPLVEQVEALACHLASYSYPTSTEAELQSAVEGVLRDGGYDFQSQVVLSPRSRLDALVRLPAGRVALELKTKGGRTALLLQLARYAESPQVDALLLVTTASRLTGLPAMVLNKPVLTVRLPGGTF